MEGLGEKLKSLRKANKETQQEIADLLGVIRQTYSEYERGNILPPPDKLIKIAQHFGVTTDSLINDANPNETLDIYECLTKCLDYLANSPNNVLYNGEVINAQKDAILTSSIANITNIISALNNSHE